MIRSYLAIVAFCLALLPRLDCNARPSLSILTNGRDSGWWCDSVSRACYAGGREGLDIQIRGLSTPCYPTLISGWPKEIRLEAGQMDGERFVPDARLYQLLQITRIIEREDRSDDSSAQAAGTFSQLQKGFGVFYRFGMTIPEEYVGQRIWIRTTYASPESEPLTGLFSLDPILPCNESARQWAQTTYVEEAYVQGFDDRAVDIADSLIALGWRHGIGLGWAITSAHFANRLEDALRLMDLDFAVNGRITVFSYGGSDPSARQAAEAHYRDRRQKLVAEIEAQKQKQNEFQPR